MSLFIVLMITVSIFLLKEISLHIVKISLRAESQEVLNDLIDENNDNDDDKCELPDIEVSGICIPAETLKTYNPKNKQSAFLLIKNGNVIYSSFPNILKDTEIRNAGLQESFKKKSYLFFVTNIKNGTLSGVTLILGRDIYDLDETLREFFFSMVFLGLMLIVVGSLIIYWKLSLEFRYLENLIFKIESIPEEKIETFEINCEPECPQEFKFLAKSFNSLMRRVSSLVKNQRSFLSNVAHELKTPLAVMLSQVEITLRKERKKDEYKEALKNMREEILRMIDTIKKLLILSRIEIDKQKIHLREICLNEVLKKSISVVTPLAEKENIRLDVKFQGKKVIKVKGDETLLIQLFVNLLENAIKYNRPGGLVSVDIFDSEKTVIVDISDTGIGISEEELENVFSRFYVLKRNNKKTGTGIGLTIVKEIADLHEASLVIKSSLSRGTTVRVSFKKL